MDEHLRPAELPYQDARGIRAGRHPRQEGEADDAASPYEAAAQPRPAVSIAPPDPLVPAPGALLVGRYRLTSRLAAGTADVWRAEDELLGRPVALKLAVAATQGSAAAERLLAEGRALAAVRHPGVVGLYDVLSGRWGVALVLELLPGETLAARLARDGPVSAPIAISVAMQLAAALDAVHRAGLVHRDVKPANVIVRPDGHIRLVDFGIARMAGERYGLTPDGQVEGTLRSIAPEQLAGGPVTHATDLYGLGTVLYELLEGRPPFDVDDPARLARLQRMGRPPMILAPAPLADLLGRLFEPNAAARPASALAVLDQLRAIAGVLGGGARASERPTRDPTSRARTPRRGRRLSRGALLGGVLAISAAVAVVGGLPSLGGLPFGGPPATSGPGSSPARSSEPSAGSGVTAVAATPGPTARQTPLSTPRPTPRPTATPRPTLPTTFGVTDPPDGATTSGRAILVRGHAPPRTTITRDIPLWFDEHTVADARGHWSMVVQLSAGENVLTFRLGDDRSTDARIRITSDSSRGGEVRGG